MDNQGASAEAVEFSRRYGEGRERRAGAEHRAGSSNRFTADKRTAFLILIAAGRTLAQACDDVGVSSVTVQTWDARGQAGHDNETSQFAALYAAALEARPASPPDPQLAITDPDQDASTITPTNAITGGVRRDQLRGSPEEPLTQDELERLLEKQARRGVVGAIKLLLERPWEKDDGANDKPEEPADPFDDAPVDLEHERQQRRAAP